MELFVVITLTILLLTLTHLINWFWRKTWDDDEFSGFVIISLLYFAFVLIIIKYIIIWGQVLIK